MLSKLKQFKDLREQGKKLQSALADETVTVRKASDKVVLTMDGNLKVTGLAIDDEMMDKSNKSKLEEAVKDAYNDGLKKMQRVMATKMQSMEGFDFPGMK